MSVVGATTPPWLRDRSSLFLTKEERDSVIHARHQVNADHDHDDDCDELWLERCRHPLEGKYKLRPYRFYKCNNRCGHGCNGKHRPLTSVDWNGR